MDFPSKEEMFVLAGNWVQMSFDFRAMRTVNRIGWTRLGRILIPERWTKFLPVTRTEDVLHHTGQAMYSAILMERFFGPWTPDVNWWDICKTLADHDIPEIFTGDTPACDPNPVSRRQKKEKDLRLSELMIESFAPRREREQMKRQQTVFNDIDGEFAEVNHAGVLDAFEFPFSLAWGEHVGIPDRLLERIKDLDLGLMDFENIQEVGTGKTFDIVLNGVLKGKVRKYEYFPIMLALVEAHYRMIPREMPDTIRKRFPEGYQFFI